MIGYKHLPIELFKTKYGYFAFDARNVQFSEIDAVAYDVLAILREREATVEKLMELLPQRHPREIKIVATEIRKLQKRGLFIPYRFRRLKRFRNNEIRYALTEKMSGMTVFVTTRCNLSCSYCIYGGQYAQHEVLGDSSMEWATLKAAMDFLERHSRKSKEIRVDFFGGEPLLAFPLIKKGVDYLKSLVGPGRRRVEVTIASNGTVMSDTILDFCIENKVYLQFSIDGDRSSHDKYRYFKRSGRGSLSTILRNLQTVYSRDPAYFEHYMRLKGVITTDTAGTGEGAFFQNPTIRIITEQGHFIFVDVEPHYDVRKDTDYFERLENLGRKILAMRTVNSVNDIVDRLNLKEKCLFFNTFNLFFEAQAVNAVYFRGKHSTPFIKGCLTGYGQGAVKTNGDIAICLKSARGDNFIIGNVIENRWYFKKIEKLNDELHEKWFDCTGCFVQKICDLCYEALDGNPGKFAASRASFCEFNKKRYRLIFDYMLRVVEKHPDMWNYAENLVGPAALAYADKCKQRL